MTPEQEKTYRTYREAGWEFDSAEPDGRLLLYRREYVGDSAFRLDGVAILLDGKAVSL